MLLIKSSYWLRFVFSGLDVNGHGYRPNSKLYLDNVKSLDKGIQRIENLIEGFYQHDSKTAYVMTSDHGMSDWGSHGSGHPHETLTPLVAWGAGVRGPEKSDINDKYPDSLSEEWNLSHLKRSDVEQADIALLMASLIGKYFATISKEQISLCCNAFYFMLILFYVVRAFKADDVECTPSLLLPKLFKQL